MNVYPTYLIQSDFQQLRDILLTAGATLVGFADVREGLAEELNHLSYAISLAIKHPPVKITSANLINGEIYSNQYAQIDCKLDFLQELAKKILKEQGWKYLIIPPDSNRHNDRFVARVLKLFPHKTAATCAGLGWIGKNGLLINEQYGARLSWATVLTDAPLQVDSPITESRCGNCSKCVKACPVEAIKGISWVRKERKELVDFRKCQNYLQHVYQTHGAMACGKCVLACSMGIIDD